MAGLFSKPKSVKPPPVPAPPAIPEKAPEVGEEAIKKAGRRRGFPKTILTGALTPETGKKKFLG